MHFIDVIAGSTQSLCDNFLSLLMQLPARVKRVLKMNVLASLSTLPPFLSHYLMLKALKKLLIYVCLNSSVG